MNNVQVLGSNTYDGNYVLINDLKTGNSRIWMLGEEYRIYYYNGWRLANADISKIYYKLLRTTISNDETIILEDGIGINHPWDTEDCVWIATNEEDAVPDFIKLDAKITVADVYTETDEDGNTVEVKKIVNLSTNNIYYERTVTKTNIINEIEHHDRYISPMLMIGNVYQFKFVKDFEQLGYGGIDPETEKPYPLRGLYRVKSMKTYFDLVTSGIDLYKNLYQPLGLSKQLYEDDFKQIENVVVYELIDVDDETTRYYMPSIFIDGTPNSAVNLYSKVMLTLDIGEHFDVELLSSIRRVVSLLLEAKWGITGEVNLINYREVWMPEDYYEEILSDRDLIKQQLYEQHGNILEEELFFTENNKLYKKYIDAVSKLATYEEIITTQGLGV